MLNKRKPRWTNAEEMYLSRHAGQMKDEEIAKKLRKTVKAIREKRARLDIKKKQGRGIVEIDDD